MTEPVKEVLVACAVILIVVACFAALSAISP